MSVITFRFFDSSVAYTVFHLFPGRDPDYQALILSCTRNVVKLGVIISFFPKPFKLSVVSFYLCFHVTEFKFSLVSRILSNVPSQIQQGVEFIRPIYEERFAKIEEYGDDWDDRPVCQTIVMESDISFGLTRRTIYSCGS